MAVPAPTAAPPNFYDSLPTGGNAPAQAAKKPETETDDEVLMGCAGCFRVMKKIGKLDDKLKPFVDKIKDDIKTLVVQGLKRDPSELESGDDGSSKAEPAPAAAPPTSTDETHAA